MPNRNSRSKNRARGRALSFSPLPTDHATYCQQISADVKDYFGSKQFQDLFESAVCGAVRSEMQKMRDQLDIANGKLMDLEVSVKGKDKVIADLQAQAERQSEKFFTLKEKANEAEQYSRRNCVRLYGIPEAKPKTKSEREDTDSAVLNLAQGKLGVDLKREDIDRSHRVGPPKEDRKSPRPIIIKLTTYRARQLLIANRRKLKGSHIGIDEDLTHQNRSLLEEAKKNPKVLAAWSSDGNIIVLLNAGNNTQVKKRVRCAQDLPKY